MQERLLRSVRAIEGFRDGVEYYDRLRAAADWIETELRALGFEIDCHHFDFQGKPYRNIIATSSGLEAGREWLAVCAHYDAVAGSPGADDNASGVAVMLETARALGPRPGLQFIAFTLEEPQLTGGRFLYGSRAFVSQMTGKGHRYRGLFNLESVGYADKRPGSQSRPPFVKVPDRGDFIALVGNGQAVELMTLFKRLARAAAPDLNVFTHRAALKGYLLPQTRFSDHAPFWDAGFPAVMLTDTAMMRNPHYHTCNDTSETLSPDFMERVAKALVSTMEELLS